MEERINLIKILKDNFIIDNMKSNSQKAQVFSTPIFYHVLFLLSLIKTVLNGFYFTFLEGPNTFSLMILELSIAYILTSDKFSNLRKRFKYSYILLYTIEENATIYYYDLFNLNPGFIVFILMLIVFYECRTTKAFHEFMFYMYILNLILLIYFPSLRNLMNFFIPFNLVLCMFVLLNVMSQSFQKKSMKLEIFSKFYESLVDSILSSKTQSISVYFEDRLLMGEPRSDSADFSTFEVKGFKGFKLMIKKEDAIAMEALVCSNLDKNKLNPEKKRISVIETLKNKNKEKLELIFSWEVLKSRDLCNVCEKIEKSTQNSKDRFLSFITCIVIKFVKPDSAEEEYFKYAQFEENKIKFDYSEDCYNTLQSITNYLKVKIYKENESLVVNFTNDEEKSTFSH